MKLLKRDVRGDTTGFIKLMCLEEELDPPGVLFRAK
jgi:hypothetical protein